MYWFLYDRDLRHEKAKNRWSYDFRKLQGKKKKGVVEFYYSKVACLRNNMKNFKIPPLPIRVDIKCMVA